MATQGKTPRPNGDAIIRLATLARDLPRLAKDKDIQGALSRILLATHHSLAALEEGRPAGFERLDAEAKKILRQVAALQRPGKSRLVAWATGTNVDSDRELIRFCEHQIGKTEKYLIATRDEEETQLDFIHDVIRRLEPNANLKRLAHLRKCLRTVGDPDAIIAMTASELARKILRAIDPSRDLKNFGAGLKRAKSPPNRSR